MPCTRMRPTAAAAAACPRISCSSRRRRRTLASMRKGASRRRLTRAGAARLTPSWQLPPGRGRKTGRRLLTWRPQQLMRRARCGLCPVLFGGTKHSQSGGHCRVDLLGRVHACPLLMCSWRSMSCLLVVTLLTYLLCSSEPALLAVCCHRRMTERAPWLSWRRSARRWRRRRCP